MNSFGASIFVPLLNIAKVLMPTSIPTELSVLDKTSDLISTTKLKKYLLAESLIIVTELDKLGSFLDQTTFSLPILAK